MNKMDRMIGRIRMGGSSFCLFCSFCRKSRRGEIFEPRRSQGIGPTRVNRPRRGDDVLETKPGDERADHKPATQVRPVFRGDGAWRVRRSKRRFEYFGRNSSAE